MSSCCSNGTQWKKVIKFHIYEAEYYFVTHNSVQVQRENETGDIHNPPSSVLSVTIMWHDRCKFV